METYWIFIIIAIVWLLYQDKIGAAIRADKALKKVLLVTGIGAAVILMIPMIFHIFLPA